MFLGPYKPGSDYYCGVTSSSGMVSDKDKPFYR